MVLSSFYVFSAKELSVRRVVLSGYRLADVLTALLLPASSVCEACAKSSSTPSS